MTIEIEDQVCDGHRLKWMVAAGLAWLEQNHHIVDASNVFPVPDGDTGKNMLLTLRSAYNEIAGMDEVEVGIVGDAVAHGALMGARGNSGVILSQLWRGFAETIRGQETFDSQLLLQALQRAVELAYAAVSSPVEGTILTVAREANEAAQALAAQDPDVGLRSLLAVLVAAAEQSLERTPELLPILKQAGVVDSGGQGLVFMLQGMQRLLNGEAVLHADTTLASEQSQDWQQALVPEDDEGYGYDVQFLMHGETMQVDAIRAAIEAMGWSTLVVGNERLIKVHVHVHDPGQPLSYAIGLGYAIDDVVVENMQEQYQDYVDERLARQFEAPAITHEVAVVAVANGAGLRHLFQHELQAATVIAGGQTMNPSTQDFMAAIDALPNDKIILLPNNKNILMAAEQAATLARDKTVLVVPSRTVPQGIAAMLAYTNMVASDNIEGIAEAMRDALGDVTCVEITQATRDVDLNGVAVHEGQYIGLLNGELVVALDSLEQILAEMLGRAANDDNELVTVYYGDALDEATAQAMLAPVSAAHPDHEFELVQGGQPLYPFIISVE